jgi:Tfp pilus assembly protein PilN
LHWTVSSKARAWSGELERWGGFQKQKQAVEAELNGIKGLIGNRTDGYAGLQRMAASLPSEVWLESWELENTAGRRFTHRLEGYTLAEARIPEFLSNLEKSGRFKTVKLKSTERIKGETVEEKTKIHANRKDLVRFQIGAVE